MTSLGWCSKIKISCHLEQDCLPWRLLWLANQESAVVMGGLMKTNPVYAEMWIDDPWKRKLQKCPKCNEVREVVCKVNRLI